MKVVDITINFSIELDPASFTPFEWSRLEKLDGRRPPEELIRLFQSSVTTTLHAYIAGIKESANR